MMHKRMEEKLLEEDWSLLPTAIVRMEVNGKRTDVLRALCDTGAQANLVSRKVVMDYKMKTIRTRKELVGVHEISAKCIEKVVGKVINKDGEDIGISLDWLVMQDWDKGMFPDEDFPCPKLQKEVRCDLADDEFWRARPIDMILGARAMAQIGEDNSMLVGGIRYQKSLLGWYAFGGAPCGNENKTSALRCALVRTSDEVEVWKAEGAQSSLEEERVATPDEEECERIFAEHHSRDQGGRYVVKIPFKPGIKDIGSSRSIALRRFCSLERRFERDTKFGEKYRLEIKKLIDTGVMVPVTEERTEENNLIYYIPHHAVLLKFRVVFDASCLTDKGISLNEVQLVGGKLQRKLAHAIMRMRRHRVAMTGDITGMYLQVKVVRSQWDVQRILWRPDPDGPVREYWLTRLTFGMSSAPHCAVRAMQQCAKDYSSIYPKAARVVHEDFYMDDCLTGANSIEEVRGLAQDLKALLHEGGFELEKFRSNEMEAISGLGQADQDLMSLDADKEVKVLGLGWNCKEDTFQFRWKPGEGARAWCKRSFLSETNHAFDPEGYVEPAIVTAKLLMNELHSVCKDWDTVLPEEYQQRCEEWYLNLEVLAKIRIPRFVDYDEAEALYGFCDASQKAYGAVVYLKATTKRVFLMSSKSRVPKDTCTIPKMELLAAELLAELMAEVIQALEWVDKPVRLFSDSTVVLSWLKSDAKKLRTFVHNRVQSIQRLSINWNWSHVKGLENPADCLSRGVMPGELLNHKLWWTGPDWLREEGKYPVLLLDRLHGTDLENFGKEFKMGTKEREYRRADVKVFTVMLKEKRLKNNDDKFNALIERMSSLDKLIRISAWVMRIATRDGLKNRECPFLTTAEKNNAMMYWVKKEQAQYYEAEIRSLNSGKGLFKNSSLRQLYPFVDKDGILRVGGRLQKAPIPEGSKHQIILPDVSRLASLLIKQTHFNTLHGGSKVMMSQIRCRYWITKLRGACRTFVSRCVECVREKAKVMEQLMGSLPGHRVEMCRAFERTSVDYAGPFDVKPDGGRSRIRFRKCVALFKCMVTGAIHLELMEDLSAKAFVNGFTRFNSLRGPVTDLWSDNGTCFVGANKELKRMWKSWKEVGSADYDELSNLKVTWHFITPAAPHQGGLWESAVKGFKHHLRRVVGKQILNGDEWRTLLAQISAVMNSRPLAPMSDNPDDLNYLTPGHFLTGRNMLQILGSPQETVPRGSLDRFEHISYMNQQFWKIWQQEVLVEMQQRTKWTEEKPNVAVGDLVLVKDENMAPSHWRRGRVVEVYPGADGKVRSCKLRLPGKAMFMKRPIQKLVLLPVH